MKNEGRFPPYLAAVDIKRKRIFVLAAPQLSALQIDGVWHLAEPLSDEEIPKYELITDIREIQKLVSEAKKALKLEEKL